MKLVMIGAGYVGLTTGACLAHLGNEVICLDRDADRIAVLEAGRLPIFEPGLLDLFEKGRAEKRLSFGVDIPKAVAKADLVFLTVGTPSGSAGAIDLSQVLSAAGDIAPHLSPETVVVVKSSVTAGTARRVAQHIARIRGRVDVAVASNPEFLREGTAVADFMNPDRIVIGADEPRAARLLLDLYRPFTKRGVHLIRTATVNAEMIKYASNAFLALKIGFINEVADFCESIGGDIDDVAAGVGSDSRIGSSFLSPGPGFGGSCLPKDTRAFAHSGRESGAPQRLIEAVVRGNEKRKSALADRIVREAGRGRGRRIAVLGAAFKAHTDDAREAAALTIVPRLERAGFEVAIHDPEADTSKYPQLKHARPARSAYQAAQDAAAVVILTDWPEYKALDFVRLKAAMAGDCLVDYRNLFDPLEVAEAGLRYVSIGRASSRSAPVYRAARAKSEEPTGQARSVASPV